MFQLILCTCPNEQVAKEIATCLVEEKLAACVTLLPNVTSVYRWQEKVECQNEVQLIIKTKKDKFNQLSDRINVLHPYDVPEIVAVNVHQGNLQYLNWISESLK
ncbi:divalent-cation tolerance protein CutA [Thalassotalea piscium]|uniref:Periplasmic divalent cation tolerance protein n=1 Tax=Thalassotalea piscium TaxID=1230533 RepID=A0A7X0NIW9_9GAMM|nr:divalent-cation tolerance protein CutA [Thalassotalea piscium]MBB6544255.1 periplasmic divalent cation tolerance protein [Thalassotalea piscium]